MNVIWQLALVLTVAPSLALLWSFYRALTTRGFIQLNAIALSLITLIGVFLVLQYLVITPKFVSVDAIVTLSPVIGGLGVAIGLVAVRNDPSFAKVFPITQTLFCALLALGVPWQGI